MLLPELVIKRSVCNKNILCQINVVIYSVSVLFVALKPKKAVGMALKEMFSSRTRS